MVSTQTPLPPWAQQLIGWGFPAELPLHIRSLGGREGGVDWALVSFPKGSMAWTPTSIVGLGTGKERLGWLGLVVVGGSHPVALWAWPLRYFFSFLPDFFLLPLPPAGALPSRLPAALVSVALLPGM